MTNEIRQNTRRIARWHISYAISYLNDVAYCTNQAHASMSKIDSDSADRLDVIREQLKDILDALASIEGA